MIEHKSFQLTTPSQEIENLKETVSNNSNKFQSKNILWIIILSTIVFIAELILLFLYAQAAVGSELPGIFTFVVSLYIGLPLGSFGIGFAIANFKRLRAVFPSILMLTSVAVMPFISLDTGKWLAPLVAPIIEMQNQAQFKKMMAPIEEEKAKQRALFDNTYTQTRYDQIQQNFPIHTSIIDVQDTSGYIKLANGIYVSLLKNYSNTDSGVWKSINKNNIEIKLPYPDDFSIHYFQGQNSQLLEKGWKDGDPVPFVGLYACYPTMSEYNNNSTHTDVGCEIIPALVYSNGILINTLFSGYITDNQYPQTP
jgi:hypothetical protein